MATISELKTHFTQPGQIEWIGLRPQRNSEIIEVESAELLAGHGLVGDKAALKLGSKRQVTIIQREYIHVMESLLNKSISPATLRRNVVVSKISLSILLRHSLKINDVVLEVTGNCAPCAKMEKALGYGAYNAMRLHGGVNAIVKKGGIINVGDKVEVCQQNSVSDKGQERLF